MNAILQIFSQEIQEHLQIRSKCYPVDKVYDGKPALQFLGMQNAFLHYKILYDALIDSNLRGIPTFYQKTFKEVYYLNIDFKLYIDSIYYNVNPKSKIIEDFMQFTDINPGVNPQSMKAELLDFKIKNKLSPFHIPRNFEINRDYVTRLTK